MVRQPPLARLCQAWPRLCVLSLPKGLSCLWDSAHTVTLSPEVFEGLTKSCDFVGDTTLPYCEHGSDLPEAVCTNKGQSISWLALNPKHLCHSGGGDKSTHPLPKRRSPFSNMFILGLGKIQKSPDQAEVTHQVKASCSMGTVPTGRVPGRAEGKTSDWLSRAGPKPRGEAMETVNRGNTPAE